MSQPKQRYALVLGANQYTDPWVTPLRFAERDASELAGFLRDGADFDRVVELLGKDLEKNRALQAARDLASALQAAGGGLLLLFFAGHGTTHLGRHCLLCPRVRLADLDEYDDAITVERLRRATELSGVDRQLVVDACRSPLRAGLREVADGYDATSLRDVAGLRGEDVRGGVWSMLASCDDGEKAVEIEALQHGIFTHVWLRELRAARRKGELLQVDDRHVAALREGMEETATAHGLRWRQKPWRLSNSGPITLLPGAVTASARPDPRPSGAVPVSVVVPAPVSAEEGDGTQFLRRIRETAQKRAEDTERKALEQKVALDRQRALFEEAYREYLAIRVQPHATVEEVYAAWAQVCRMGGSAEIPDHPGDLEWTETGVRPVRGLPSYSRTRPYRNGIGMRLVPVQTGPGATDVLLCSVWLTRVKDYVAYAGAVADVDEHWRDPFFRQQRVTPEPECPVVCVNLGDAMGFCQWLTRLDQDSGRIPRRAHYRLPTDEEWSWMVGIGEAEARQGRGRTPREKDEVIGPGNHAFAFPWGSTWPPRHPVGNYAGVELRRVMPGMSVLENYDDGHAMTSPVGLFPPSADGLHDLGGNVWEMCSDRMQGDSGPTVLRGGAWTSVEEKHLLSSFRLGGGVGGRFADRGFRVVLEGVPGVVR